MPQSEVIRKTRVLLLGLYTVLALTIVAIGVLSYQAYSASLRTQVAERLSSIANLKTTEISAWRTERVSDGELLRRTPGFQELVNRVMIGAEEKAARVKLAAWFAEIQKADDYAQVSLVDTQGERVLSVPENNAAIDSGLVTAMKEAMASNKVTVADFHRDGPAADQVHLSIVVPVTRSNGGQPLGVIALKIDPNTVLYPYIQQWPGQSASAETLLVERSGNDALFVSELRFLPDSALNTRIPLTKTNVPAVQAVLGNETVMDGVDYRGVPVVAATKRVEGSPWSVVARVDASEVYAPLKSRQTLTVVLGALVLVLGLLGILLALRNQSLRLHREQLIEEAERAWLASALESSLNEIYVFDAANLHFEHLNRGALENIGYSMEELLAMTPIDIKPEFTAQSFRQLVKPLLDGAKSVIVFETMHRRKNGSEYPAEFHLQLTERGGKKVFLAIVLDITARRAQEAELLRYRDGLEQQVVERTEQLQEANEELAVANEELVTTNEELSAVNEELAALNQEFEASNEELHALYREAAEASQELVRLNEALAQSDNAKSDFLASMSHELRTPLNSVIGFSDIMLQGLAGELNAEQQRQMEMINSSGKHLLSLINDVLDLSKIEAGRMESEVKFVDLCAEVVEIVESVRPQADALGLELMAVGVAQPLRIETDERMVKQVLFNLVSNALKFTDEGSVRVEVIAETDTVRIAVTDTGAGIALQDLELIFDQFTQVRTADRRPEGTGLGLAVSSRLAALLGGELAVESTLGKGSTFTLSIPNTRR